MMCPTAHPTPLKSNPLAAVAVTLPVRPATRATGYEAKWSAALEAYENAKAEAEAFDPTYMVVWEQCHEECKAVPHAVLRPDPHSGRHSPISTADDWYVRRARRDVAALNAGRMRFEPLQELQEYESLLRDVVSAADGRDATIQAIRDRYDMDKLDTQSEEISERLCAARDRVMNTAAPDLAALRWKLDQLISPDGEMLGWTADFIRQTVADYRQLLGGNA